MSHAAFHPGHRVIHAVFAEPVFAEDGVSPDPLAFGTPHPSDGAVYQQIGDLLKTQTVPIPAARGGDDALYSLADAYGTAGEAVVAAIRQAGRIVFHSVGDTGASNIRRYHDELRVADQLSADARTPEDATRPSFFFHLGDVIYNFGEAKYYYDQFYEPFRAYPAPIVAIPGNHDSFVVPGTDPADEALTTFQRQFCAEQPTITREAGSLHRTAMTQPGVYFTMDAPFVRVIGLFSNALEDPGVISSEGGRWPGVDDRQLTFLAAQLRRIKAENYAGAVLIATHHPPFVYRAKAPNGTRPSNHAGSTDMLREIDRVCATEGVYPHAVLSAHAHCYQRFTRTLDFGGGERQVPFVVCGNGGHNVNPLVAGSRGFPAQEPENGTDVSYLENKPAIDAVKLKLEKFDDHEFGYLRVSVNATQLRIGYHQAGVRSLLQSRFDLVTVDLATGRLVAN